MMMLEIRIHGRGGQGAVIASQILSYAFFLAGKYAQSFPTFGAERRGAPVAAFVRVSDAFINLRSQVVSPDHVIVLSAKLAETVNVTSGINPEGILFINSDKPPEYYSFLEDHCRLVTANINRLALKHGLGNRIMPLVNAPVLGAFAKVSGLVSREHLEAALPRFIPASLEANRRAMLEAYASEY
ncbi:MAG: 2-oxoacid:acceptor oxidoreductase family protein [Desulfohalobiaceae bacterium]|nr:2-oxoacid:acceptor oxidoreductase family protein [Desulfohalobiaceae bacterium]